MTRLYKLFIIMLIGTFISSCSTTKKATGNNIPEIKNIILLIGDGMGLPHVYAAMTVSDTALNIERCNIIGLQKTYSANNYITDSGAAGTALAT